MSFSQILEDKRTGCLSVLHTANVNDYLALVERVYKDQGGIEGQRAPLKTKTGIRIRKRMVTDIIQGTILPPMVIGVLLSEERFDEAKELEGDDGAVKAFLDAVAADDISIIDGMQRTTALMEANEGDVISDNPVRMELWLAKSVNSLIYRMLVLNTGQVPWDIKRQLETIYTPVLKFVSASVPDVGVLFLDGKERRSRSGQFQSSKLIEFFLSFASRKVHVDVKERVAEDFARMEATEAISSGDFLNHFTQVLALMVNLDKAFEAGKSNIGDYEIEGKFKSGKDIFTSAPAGLGFVAAAAVYLYGPPAFPVDEYLVSKRAEELKVKIEGLLGKVNGLDPVGLTNFIDLVGLNEKLSRRSGKVGEFEREFFFKAFKTLIEYADELPSMEPCWAAM